LVRHIGVFSGDRQEDSQLSHKLLKGPCRSAGVDTIDHGVDFDRSRPTEQAAMIVLPRRWPEPHGAVEPNLAEPRETGIVQMTEPVDAFRSASRAPLVHPINEALDIVNGDCRGTRRSSTNINWPLTPTFPDDGHLFLAGRANVDGQSSAVFRSVNLRDPARTPITLAAFGEQMAYLSMCRLVRRPGPETEQANPSAQIDGL
jgi:hypothetical protein